MLEIVIIIIIINCVKHLLTAFVNVEHLDIPIRLINNCTHTSISHPLGLTFAHLAPAVPNRLRVAVQREQEARHRWRLLDPSN